MNTQDVLKYGHLTVLHTLESVPSVQWEITGVCGYWSVKDILAHLASYEQVLTEVFNGFIEPGPTPTLDKMLRSGDSFNDEEVSLRAGKTADQVLAEYKDTCLHNMNLAARISGEKLRAPGTLPWYGKEYSLEDYIVYSFYGHKREHSAQIAVAASVWSKSSN